MRKKEKLIERILHIDDESVLEGILEMVDLELNLAGDTVSLTEDQKIFIDEGLKDIKEDNLISDEEAKKRSKEWFKDK